MGQTVGCRFSTNRIQRTGQRVEEPQPADYTRHIGVAKNDPRMRFRFKFAPSSPRVVEAPTVLEDSTRQPLIARFYYRFIDEGNVASFVREVSLHYTPVTLQRVVRFGGRAGRRGAALALTLIGGPDGAAAVGEALQDEDRGVRMIAEQGLPAMWLRAAGPEAALLLQSVLRLNAMGDHLEALDSADELLASYPTLGEAWRQRAEAQRSLGVFEEAVGSYQQALECEPFHFQAAWDMAECYLELGDAFRAIDCLKYLLQIHPHYELARMQLLRLQRDLREQADF